MTKKIKGKNYPIIITDKFGGSKNKEKQYTGTYKILINSFDTRYYKQI